MRVCARLQSQRLFQIGHWHLAGAFQEAIKISTINLVKVLLDESIEIGAVDFVKVSFLASERYATENNIGTQYGVNDSYSIQTTMQPKEYYEMGVGLYNDYDCIYYKAATLK